MLKEIQSSCSLEDAQVLINIKDRYPVTVDISPYISEGSTVVIFKEKEEGIIGANFFGDMQKLLAYSALFDQLEQENKTQVPAANLQQVPVMPQFPENAPTIPAFSNTLVTLWSRFCLFYSNLKPNYREA